jgi:hypothetical protein
MYDQGIIDAIRKALPGIGRYIAIMDTLYSVDVSSDVQFQKMYNAFYRVRQKQATWYAAYYQLMQESKGKSPTFHFVLAELSSRLGGAYEPSFSSKLVATLNPWRPVWDKHVLKNTGHTPPSYSSPTKQADAIQAYASINAWYVDFMRTDKAKRWVRLFNENVDLYFKITDIKKVDFILWQTRRQPETANKSFQRMAMTGRR